MLRGAIRFTNAAVGTADFIYPGPAIDMQSPAAAGVVDGASYTYYAQSLDMVQWEIGQGVYTLSSGTFARTTVLANSLGTTAKIAFGNPPQIAVFDTSAPTAPTPPAGDVSSRIATTDFVRYSYPIPPGTDWNTIKQNGFYSTSDNTCTNTPSALNGGANFFFLQVEAYAAAPSTDTKQTAFSNGNIFVRQQTSGSWTAWRVVLNTTGGQTITGGFKITPFSIGNISGSFTPDPINGNYQYGTNHGAITFNVPASDCAIDILLTNDATAGAITFSGYTVGANTGDALTTTNASKFIVSIRRINGISTYMIKALQ